MNTQVGSKWFGTISTFDELEVGKEYRNVEYDTERVWRYEGETDGPCNCCYGLFVAKDNGEIKISHPCNWTSSLKNEMDACVLRDSMAVLSDEANVLCDSLLEKHSPLDAQLIVELMGRIAKTWGSEDRNA